MQTQERTPQSGQTSAAIAKAAPDPSRILEVGFSFFSSKVLLTAVKLEVFTALADRSMTGGCT